MTNDTKQNDFKNYLQSVIENPNYEHGKEHLAASADCFFPVAARELQALGVAPEHLVHFLMTSAYEVLGGETDELLKAALRLCEPERKRP